MVSRQVASLALSSWRHTGAENKYQGEVHCNTCEGANAGLRIYLRALRGVHKRCLYLYVATYEAMVNTKRVTPTLIRRMCVCNLCTHTGYT